MGPNAPHRYLLGLGSNLGERATYLAAALTAIARRLGTIEARAPLYETAPIGAADRPFLNSAALCRSVAAPAEALAILLAVEAELGRVRRERWGNRVIDLDLLLWSGEAEVSGATPPDKESGRFEAPGLSLPHPRLLERDFALVPAADVAPDWRHPETGRRLADEVALRGYRLTPIS